MIRAGGAYKYRGREYQDMVFDDFDFSGGDTPVRITQHAQNQWRARVGDRTGMMYPFTEQTWRDAEFVIAPDADCDEARVAHLNGKRDMLLCGHHRPHETVVATVLYADEDRLYRP